MNVTDFTTPSFDLLEEVSVVELTRTGRIIKVRVMDAPDGTAAAISVRELMLEEFWHRIREAQALAALTGRPGARREHSSSPGRFAGVGGCNRIRPRRSPNYSRSPW